MAKKRMTPQQQQAFYSGIAFERNRIIDFIQYQIDTCPIGLEECNGCGQDSRLIDFLLSQSEQSSQGESSAAEING
jgi:hypothetical protein